MSTFDYIWQLCLWSFVPPLLAKFILHQYYRLSGRRKPADSSKEYQRIYVFVTCTYLVYCLANFIATIESNYYQTIGVHREDVETKLKSHFRQMVISLHPDKTTEADSSKFMEIKRIYETLNNSPSRQLYDCYGEQILNTVENSSSRTSKKGPLHDYLTQALIESGIFYFGTGTFFLVSTVLGGGKGLYWRFLSFFAVFSLEIYILMRPLSFGAPSPRGDYFCLPHLMRYLANFTTFQKIRILRQLYMYSSMAIGQVAGLFGSPNSTVLTKDIVNRIRLVAERLLDPEADALLKSSTSFLSSDEPAKKVLLREVGRLLVNLDIFDEKN